MAKRDQEKHGHDLIDKDGGRARGAMDVEAMRVIDVVDTLTVSTRLLNDIIIAHPEPRDELLPVLEQLVGVSEHIASTGHRPGHKTAASFDSTAGAEEDRPMEARIAAIEKDVSVLKTDVAVLKTDVAVLKTDVAVLKTDVAVIRSNYVTKEDLQKELHKLTWRILGFISLVSATVYYIARYVH